MHPETGLGVPAFLGKLWKLVENPETDHLISWSSDGRSFIIRNQAKFAKELLPLNYKHNQIASFIRQLNMYGFHKITSIDNGGLKFDKDEMEFSHQFFQKGHPYLLEHIKRKIGNPKQVEAEKAASPKTETVTRVLNEVKNMNRRQESLDTRFSAMKQENEALWREVAILRQKHQKQQNIVNKLIQFLVTIVQPQRSGLGSGIGKRRCQLMIDEAPQSKFRKSSGPIISELTEELLEDDSDLEEIPINNTTHVQSPGSQSSKGSSSFEQDYIYASASTVPDVMANFINNNYGNHNYFAADYKNFDGQTSNSVGSGDSLNLDDIDEIDTSQMQIYDSANIKNRRPEVFSKGKVQTKKESNEVPQTSSSAGKSLLKNVKEIEEDLLKTSNDVTGEQAMAGTSSADPMVYDASTVLADELFNFEGKSDDQLNTDDMTVTKYNPKCTEDINRLNSVNDFSGHLDNVQNDLDSLKDLLRNDTYQLDANQLLGNAELPIYMSQHSFDPETINKLFGGDDLVGYEMSPANMDLFTDDKKDQVEGVPGSELMTYQPSPYNNSLDLNELLNVGDDNIVKND